MPKVSTWNGKKCRPKSLDAVVALNLTRWRSIMPTRARVLDHMYCVIGNGYSWQNGRLLPEYPIENDEDFAAEEAAENSRMRERMKGILSDEELDEFMAGLNEPSAELLAYNKFYPLSDYSRVCKIPDDVRDDYLLGAVEVMQLAVASDEDERHPGNPQRAKEILEGVFTRFKDRLEGLGVTAG